MDFRKAMDELGKWKKFRVRGVVRAPLEPVGSPLVEIRNLTANPGNLRMFYYIPPSLAEPRALVVVLHGCGQTAAVYNHGAGWSTLAKRYGFALLFPEQQRSNNPNGCFNWFEPGDTRRDGGEAASIRATVDRMVRDHGIDRDRVFITGLSAGGAMTSAMLACYPEVFAGGAIIAGLPYGAADNVQRAFESMFQCPSRPSREWGDRVRSASPRHNGPWPRVSVWHGNADKTVVPSNAREILKQWTDVHGLAAAPSAQSQVDGYPREVWLNQAGDEVIDSYTITHMAHGTPLATGHGDLSVGASGPFMLEVGISSTYHIAKFFALTAAGVRAEAAIQSGTVAARPSAGAAEDAERSGILYGEVLGPESATEAQDRPAQPRVDISAIITRALEAAGLMKR
jgi:poly(hydroxyalkanoate) depolymerase family esterase